KYRIAPRYRHPAPLQDAQRAVRFTRAHAKRRGIDPARVGVLGFSAGGHLASTAGTHFDAGRSHATDPVDRRSRRPACPVPGSPVTALAGPRARGGSRDNRVGKDAAPKLFERLSTDGQVTKQTPPAFLVHTTEDRGVPPENSVLFYLALRKGGVPAELHIYE